MILGRGGVVGIPKQCSGSLSDSQPNQVIHSVQESANGILLRPCSAWGIQATWLCMGPSVLHPAVLRRHVMLGIKPGSGRC